MATYHHLTACRLCGRKKAISFEHTPPQAAGNTKPLQFRTLDDVIRGRQSSTKFPRGLGTPTVCADCNTRMGDYYVSAYVDWIDQARTSMSSPQTGDGYFYFTIRPLNVLKQVVVMALAMVAAPQANAAAVTAELAKHSELRDFVLDPTSKSIPFGYGIYVHLTDSKTPRFERLVATVNTTTQESYQTLAEIVLPPLGHTIVGQRFPLKAMQVKGLCPMNWFSLFDYDETATVPLRLPILPITTYLPNDYRSEEEVSLLEVRQEILELLDSRYSLS
jgi:hypothetical protein